MFQGGEERKADGQWGQRQEGAQHSKGASIRGWDVALTKTCSGSDTYNEDGGWGGLTCVLLQAKGSRGMRLRAHTPSDVEVGGQEATSRRPRLEQLGLLRVNGRALASTPPQI